MKYRCTQPFIAFGKTPEVGEIVELTTEQAEALRGMDNIAPYEVKIERPVNRTPKKKLKQSASARPARHSQKKTAKRSKKTAKK